MYKKILAFITSFLFIFFNIMPATTVFADVVVGDNDVNLVTELGIRNGKKIAVLESMAQLLENGVTELSFNDVSDLDTFIDDFIDELDNISFTDVSNSFLADAYNDVQSFKQWVEDRGNYIATYYKDYLNSADQGLSDIFNNFQLKLPKSELVPTTLNGFKGMSRFRSTEPTPTPTPVIPNDIVDLGNALNNWSRLDTSSYTGPITSYIWGLNVQQRRSYSYYNALNSGNPNWNFSSNDAGYRCNVIATNPMTINITYNGSTYSVSYSYGSVSNQPFYYKSNNTGAGNYSSLGMLNSQVVATGCYNNYNSVEVSISNQSFNYMYQTLTNRYRNVKVTYNGITVIDPFNVQPIIIIPNIELDGQLKIYGTDYPVMYEFPYDTQIDYNALYTTIYNAIRDNLPIDMQTINNNQVYYDSHDTVYSPTINNYYNQDSDNENDWIESILDYAIVPKFDTALLTPLEEPITNGVVIAGKGLSVFPTDIIFVIGAGFVLILFGCIINRMIE